MNTERLIKNMMDQLAELQVKLGYARETVRLYYPVTSLTTILGVPLSGTGTENAPEGEELTGRTGREDLVSGFTKEQFRAFLAELNEDPALQGSGLGRLTFAGNRTRLSVSIPPEGSEYVHEHHRASAFLVDLITLFQEHHHCGLEEVQAVFARHAGEAEPPVGSVEAQSAGAPVSGYICEQMPPEADFDYVLYFEDPSVDEYYYCIKMEMGHTIYHRFMREDYEALL